jgi:predicted nucleotidyltransferase
MAPVEYILGMNSVEEVDLSVKSKDEAGKNTTEAVDAKLYEFRRFCKLAVQNNPNIIEILFVNEPNIIVANDIGQELLSMAKTFPCKEASRGFLGYAKAQKHKMIIKKDHFEELLEGYRLLEMFDPKAVMGQVYDYHEIRSETNIFQKKGTGVHIHIGDINFEPGVYVKKAMTILKERLDRATNRTDLILKYGYDCKYGMHLIRLLREGIDLMQDGCLTFPLAYAEELLDIRKGNWKVERVIEYAEQLEAQYEAAIEKSILPTKPSFNKVNEFAVRQMKIHVERQSY